MLREANIGAAKLSLEKDGFALPRYSESPKVAYVLQGRAWDLEESVVKTLVGNQSGNRIVKLDAGFKMTEAVNDHRNGMMLNCLEAPLDVDIKILAEHRFYLGHICICVNT